MERQFKLRQMAMGKVPFDAGPDLRHHLFFVEGIELGKDHPDDLSLAVPSLDVGLPSQHRKTSGDRSDSRVLLLFGDPHDVDQKKEHGAP